MKRINVILFVTVLLLSFGCNTTTNQSTPGQGSVVPNYDFSTLSQAYLFFLPESYWIYQDDSTLSKDTVSIYSTQEEIRKQNPGTTAEFTYKAMWEYFNYNKTGLLKAEMFANNLQVPDNIPNTEERIYFSQTSYKIAFGPMFPFGARIAFGGEEGTFINKEKIAQWELNGNTYLDVYHAVSEDYSEFPGDTVFYHFYYAKNYGLIKYSFEHKGLGHSYSLIKALVKQSAE